jgi:hypothetical protein
MLVGSVCGVGGLAVLSLAALALALRRGRLSAVASQKHRLRLWAVTLPSPASCVGPLSP